MSTFEDMSAEMLNSTALLVSDQFGKTVEEWNQAERNLHGLADVLAEITHERKRREEWHKLTDCEGKHADHAVVHMPPAPVGWKIGDPIPEAQ